MEEPQYGFIQYRGLTITDLLAHIDYSRIKGKSAHLFELRLCPTGISIPLKQKVYKIKPVELQCTLGSSYFGRDGLSAIRETLKARSFDLKIRYSPKLRLITTVVAAVPMDDPGFESRLTELLKIVARESGFGWPTTMAAEHRSYTNIPKTLPGEVVHNTEMLELGHKFGRAFGALIRYLAIGLLLAGVLYFYYYS